MIPTLLVEYHATPTDGHMGMTKTTNCLLKNFDWPWLRQDVIEFISQCLDCQHVKYETKRTAGLLCPLPVPYRPWKDLSLDFITGLSLFRGNLVIFVVVVALFMDIVGKIHGLPRSLVSDRDPLFLSKF